MKRLQGYIEKIRKYLGEKDYDTIKKETPTPDKNSTEKLIKSVSNITIPVSEAIDIFNGIFVFLGLSQRARLGKPGEVGSIYDSPTELVIPNSKEFETLSVKRILTLISHEILCHYINQKNHEANNGKLRYVGNVEKEEGLAILSEKGLLGSKLSGKDLITTPFSRILAGEILEPKEFEDFLDLYSDITERKSSPEALKYRHKRNQEDSEISVQHKDVAYIRGLIANVAFLLNGGDIEHLFVGKVGLEAIMSGDFAFDSETMMFPILLTDIFVFFLLSSKGGNMKFTHEHFVAYIESKYGEVIKKESFQKLEKVLSGRRMLELFVILSPLLEAISLNGGVDAGVSKNVERIRVILDKIK